MSIMSHRWKVGDGGDEGVGGDGGDEGDNIPRSPVPSPQSLLSVSLNRFID